MSLIDQIFSYKFKNTWRIYSDILPVAECFLDHNTILSWWSNAFYGVDAIESGGEFGQGRKFNIVTKGWLPYLLRFQLHVVEVNWPTHFRVESTGDFLGTGDVRLEQLGDQVVIHFDWQIEVAKPLLKWLTPIASPILKTNHYWMMRIGERGMQNYIDGEEESNVMMNIFGFRIAQTF